MDRQQVTKIFPVPVLRKPRQPWARTRPSPPEVVARHPYCRPRPRNEIERVRVLSTRSASTLMASSRGAERVATSAGTIGRGLDPGRRRVSPCRVGRKRRNHTPACARPGRSKPVAGGPDSGLRVWAEFWWLVRRCRGSSPAVSGTKSSSRQCGGCQATGPRPFPAPQRSSECAPHQAVADAACRRMCAGHSYSHVIQFGSSRPGRL